MSNNEKNIAALTILGVLAALALIWSSAAWAGSVAGQEKKVTTASLPAADADGESLLVPKGRRGGGRISGPRMSRPVYRPAPRISRPVYRPAPQVFRPAQRYSPPHISRPPLQRPPSITRMPDRRAPSTTRLPITDVRLRSNDRPAHSPTSSPGSRPQPWVRPDLRHERPGSLLSGQTHRPGPSETTQSTSGILPQGFSRVQPMVSQSPERILSVQPMSSQRSPSGFINRVQSGTNAGRNHDTTAQPRLANLVRTDHYGISDSVQMGSANRPDATRTSYSGIGDRQITSLPRPSNTAQSSQTGGRNRVQTIQSSAGSQSLVAGISGSSQGAGLTKPDTVASSKPSSTTGTDAGASKPGKDPAKNRNTTIQQGTGNTTMTQQTGRDINNIDNKRNIVRSKKNESRTVINNYGGSGVGLTGGRDWGPIPADPELIPVPIPVPVPVEGDEHVIVDPVPWPPVPQPVGPAHSPSPAQLIDRAISDCNQSDYVSAESRLKLALDMLQASAGGDPRLMANALERLADVYDQTRRGQEAAGAREEARKVRAGS